MFFILLQATMENEVELNDISLQTDGDNEQYKDLANKNLPRLFDSNDPRHNELMHFVSAHLLGPSKNINLFAAQNFVRMQINEDNQFSYQDIGKMADIFNKGFQEGVLSSSKVVELFGDIFAPFKGRMSLMSLRFFIDVINSGIIKARKLGIKECRILNIIREGLPYIFSSDKFLGAVNYHDINQVIKDIATTRVNWEFVFIEDRYKDAQLTSPRSALKKNSSYLDK